MKKKHITDKIYPTSPPSEPVPNRFREGRGAFIGIFGRRNTGKSSLINLLTGQDIAIVSDKPGTTTDPVSKSVEIFGIGPVVLIDTAGIDDAGELGEKRIKKSKEAIKKADCAILVIAENTFDNFELDLIKLFDEYAVPYLIVHNKSDLSPLTTETIAEIKSHSSSEILDFSTQNEEKKELLISLLKSTIPTTNYQKPSLLGGLVQPKDVVLLITPIDSEAPEGRMILPQNMAIRDVLENNCITVVVKETELEDFFKLGIKPALAITDSQAFNFVSKIVPTDVPLTSFSIVFARLKGDFEKYLEGTPHISQLKDGDRVLILESCTHQVSCDDIGRVKIPGLLQKFTGKKLEFTVVSGLSEVTENVESLSLVIQCGGCMVTRKQLLNRLKPFTEAEIPVTNYGMALAYVNGIFERATAPFL
ncbi:MAG TPA: [FeFe] hydrogenase H-cluster maturation GTPase HydF [Paludibacteraceae bacterium]|nr:[FeFe] hydrogenase H-cluster maturation GTPase HydF [Paludibacteraceae bacterium]HPT42393.1 [FeFe] hydrogenase H-cluster maturation GTPase HydF [Paludibacteraceae bacterium]